MRSIGRNAEIVDVFTVVTRESTRREPSVDPPQGHELPSEERASDHRVSAKSRSSFDNA